MIKIAPSILSADFAVLGQEIKKLDEAGADLIHFDVMDGHFVPNITFGPMILRDLKKHTHLPFDVHLMVKNPKIFIPWYADAGADIITFHLEATENPENEITLIHNLGKKVGISIKPNTDIELLRPFIAKIDMVLVMSVEPGFGGQKFNEDTPNRIRKIKDMLSAYNVLIEVDGGINSATATLCKESGADILVAGSSIFKTDNYLENITNLRDA